MGNRRVDGVVRFEAHGRTVDVPIVAFSRLPLERDDRGVETRVRALLAVGMAPASVDIRIHQSGANPRYSVITAPPGRPIPEDWWDLASSVPPVDLSAHIGPPPTEP